MKRIGSESDKLPPLGRRLRVVTWGDQEVAMEDYFDLASEEK